MAPAGAMLCALLRSRGNRLQPGRACLGFARYDVDSPGVIDMHTSTQLLPLMSLVPLMQLVLGSADISTQLLPPMLLASLMQLVPDAADVSDAASATDAAHGIGAAGA